MPPFPPYDIILDGVGTVNILQPGPAKTFYDYAAHVVLPYITSKLQHVSRVDVVWDEYLPGILKAEEVERRLETRGPIQCSS